VMQDVSDKLLGQFTACLEQKVGDASAAGQAAAAAAAAAEAGADDSGEGSVATVDTATDTATDTGADTGAESGDEHRMNNLRTLEPPNVASTNGPPREVNLPGNDEALDLGATVLPVIAKAYWKQAVGLLLLLLVLRRLLSRG